jgi:hypothetical protein
MRAGYFYVEAVEKPFSSHTRRILAAIISLCVKTFGEIDGAIQTSAQRSEAHPGGF